MSRRLFSAALPFSLAPLTLAIAMSGLGCSTIVIDNRDPGSQGDQLQQDQGKDALPAPVCGQELHILGVYETHSGHGYGNHPTGAATVHVERKGSSVLALSSYEPVHWTVTAEPGVVLEKVILNGYHDQTADVPEGVPVEIHSGPDKSLGAYGYAWPSSEGGSDTPALVDAFEGEAGRAMTSFHGCYQANTFVLHDDLSVSSSCNVEAGYALTGHVESTCDAAEAP
jgi:hypothetical protein